MPEVNFLPTDQIQNKKVRAVSGNLKIFAALLGFVCLTIGVLGTFFIVYRSSAVGTLEKQEADLKAQVLAQETTEQTLVFVRDRLTKVKEIQAKNANNENFLAEKETFATLPAGVDLKQLDLTLTDSDFAVTIPDSQTLEHVLELVKTKVFANGYVDTISYNSVGGYQVKFKIK
jgi:hypothetical protein